MMQGSHQRDPCPSPLLHNRRGSETWSPFLPADDPARVGKHRKYSHSKNNRKILGHGYTSVSLSIMALMRRIKCPIYTRNKATITAPTAAKINRRVSKSPKSSPTVPL